jgi:hypothetical protein
MKTTKNHGAFILMFGILLAISCGGNDKIKTPQKEKPLSTTCYVAIYENDTAKMELSFIDSTKVKGKLKIHYAIGEKNNGTFKGAFKGDTLFVDYVFSPANTDRGGYTNPLVFLRKDKKLIMGVGQIETTLGRSYFVKGKPLNFERGKFVFEPTACNK